MRCCILNQKFAEAFWLVIYWAYFSAFQKSVCHLKGSSKVYTISGNYKFTFVWITRFIVMRLYHKSLASRSFSYVSILLIYAHLLTLRQNIILQICTARQCCIKWICVSLSLQLHCGESIISKRISEKEDTFETTRYDDADNAVDA